MQCKHKSTKTNTMQTKNYCNEYVDGLSFHWFGLKGPGSASIRKALAANEGGSGACEREELHTHVRRCAWEYIVFFGNLHEEQVLVWDPMV